MNEAQVCKKGPKRLNMRSTNANKLSIWKEEILGIPSTYYYLQALGIDYHTRIRSRTWHLDCYNLTRVWHKNLDCPVEYQYNLRQWDTMKALENHALKSWNRKFRRNMKIITNATSIFKSFMFFLTRLCVPSSLKKVVVITELGVWNGWGSKTELVL